MTPTRKMLVPLFLLLAAGAPAEDTGSPDVNTPLEGLWRLITSEVIAPDGTRFPGNPHESFLLFAGDHYSMNMAGGNAPAPWSADQFRPTDAEKVARYSTLIVNAGRFGVDGTVLTIRPDFALVPEYVGGAGEFDYTLAGDTLDPCGARSHLRTISRIRNRHRRALSLPMDSPVIGPRSQV